MSKTKGSLTKVAKGVAYGDVSNNAVRNILTEVSKVLYAPFTEDDMVDTMEYFDWCCPYTGRYLKDDYDAKNGNYATDHIYPQNRVWVGLNVVGNLVLVDKKANSKKRDQSVDEFMLYDTEVLGDLDDEIRMERLQKIKKFQEEKQYDPEKIKTTISSLMKKRYDDVRAEQEAYIADVLKSLESAGILPKNDGASSVIKHKGTRKSTKSLGSVKAAEDNFKKYLIEECGYPKTTADAYRSGLNKILKELEMKDIYELERTIDRAIDYCTKERDNAKNSKDKKRAKKYSDIRSAIKKYRDFIEGRNNSSR